MRAATEAGTAYNVWRLLRPSRIFTTPGSSLTRVPSRRQAWARPCSAAPEAAEVKTGFRGKRKSLARPST